ncbi:hypothetical protein [Burkholderia cenocepacia]|uniref:hypothetical protein n=1 Tax=Burkholderia cenocepacia TaxID=95486 RepID=UPI001B9A4859|nr:hypothetical protein [Burkholderia cenocepacia]MBR8098968.1 hypothetical protein [Burkholderia cenocepacia]MDI9685516.1 hypothetical protein [Burkholderia cenocepacia]HEP6429171.1 hypothetical protein [Burkholderia cenocepacia]
MLIDLDELVSECPDPRSRKYIRESVQCYKAGAYRAAVVACWIAVAFDLVDKIRELAATGDAMAQEAIAKFDRARHDGDVRTALTFEKELLTLARDKFEFISPIECIDLERLVSDRNRCAHPSLVSDTEVFEASPELARLHIVNATRYVLSQPAAQGKQALDRLESELDSNFFPVKPADAIVFLRAGPLAKPRESLLRNYIAILLKRLLKQTSLEWEKRRRTRTAFFAVAEIHPEPWKRILRELLSAIIPTLQDDDQLATAAKFIGSRRGAEIWVYLSEADRLRLATFVENIPEEHLDSLEDFLKDKNLPFFNSALSRIKHASHAEVFDTPWFDTPQAVINRMLDFYRHCQSYSQANEFGNNLRFALSDSETPKEHLARLAEAGAKNDQVRNSNQFPVLVKGFVKDKFNDKEIAIQMLRDAGLEELADGV